MATRNIIRTCDEYDSSRVRAADRPPRPMARKACVAFERASCNEYFSLQLGIMALLCVLLAAGAGAQADEPAAYDGLKKTVSVDPFLATESVGGSVTGEGLTVMLTDALVNDGRFVVVERSGLTSVQSEQALGTAKGGATETAARTGQLIGASAIVRGTVIKYEAAAGGGSLGVNSPLGSLFGAQATAKRQHAVLTISLRLIDTTTSQVISTTEATGDAASTSADANVVDRRNGATFGGSAFANTPIGQAAQDAIVKAVHQIADGMRKVAWSAQVVNAGGGKVYVNAGADRNVRAGLVLIVYRKGQTFTDPSTGEFLDVDLEKIGTIRIETVRERLSVAVVESGPAPSRGDILKLN
jgi:curli biogenesis system outer membrane secretion channel CsgG